MNRCSKTWCAVTAFWWWSALCGGAFAETLQPVGAAGPAPVLTPSKVLSGTANLPAGTAGVVAAAQEPALESRPALVDSGSPRIAAVRLWPAQEYTRVAIETTRQVQHTFFSLRNPDRLVLDLHSIEYSAVLSDLPSKVAAEDPHIRAIRVARNRPGVMRIVFDLKTSVDANVFPVRPIGSYGHRLVIDIVPTQPLDPLMALLQNEQASASAPAKDGAASPAAAKEPSAVSPPTGSQTPPLAAAAPPVSASQGQAAPAPPPVPATSDSNAKQAGTPQQASSATAPGKTAQAEVERLLIVAVDAGHGGEDPGARGKNGTREKDVTLAIARRIRAELESEPNVRVVLTRDGDYFVPLASRVAKARRARADIFVSIHADAFVRPDARGSSVFALSPRGASSAAARWLAQQENQADLIGGVNLSKRDPNLARTLLDLSQTATINDSLHLGRLVLREIGGLNRLHKPRVEQAGFAVLKAPDIPSILVETAFISNPVEERRLGDADYQIRMARVIVDGIKKYLAVNAPTTARAKVALK